MLALVALKGGSRQGREGFAEERNKRMPAWLQTTLTRSTIRAAFVGAMGLALAAPAAAQTMGFDPSDFGKVSMPRRQSTGDAATHIESNKGAFEPIAELDQRDPLAKMAKPVGRIDILLKDNKTGKQTGAHCTGELLPGDYVLTNHHCLPQSGEMTPVRAIIVMDFLTQDGKGAKVFELDPKPVEFNANLDYAIAKAKGNPTATYGSVKLAATPTGGAPSLMVIHHPAGRPKVMSRFRCMATRQQGDAAEMRHRCDTLGGSSGSLLYNATNSGIALHKQGGLAPNDPNSYNTATSMTALLQASPLLRKMAGAGGQAPAADGGSVASGGGQDDQPSSTERSTLRGSDNLDTDGMNSLLKN